MQGSTWTMRLSRLAVTLGVMCYWFAAGQFLTYHLVIGEDINTPRCNSVVVNKTFKEFGPAYDYADSKYMRSFFGYEGDLEVSANDGSSYTLTGMAYPNECNWLTSSTSWISRVIGFAMGLLATVLSALILFGLLSLARWIWRGPDDYDDPCYDDDCPCARHEQERIRAERAHTMMVAAAAGAVAGTIAGN